MATERPIKAKYLIETAFPLEKAAEIMAGEQSCGTFVKVPGETAELRENHAAMVESIEELGEVISPTLSGSKVPKTGVNPVYKRAHVVLAWPYENIGSSLQQLMAAAAGNLYELGPFSGLKLLDLTIPDVFKEKYAGPQFGTAGTRKLIGMEDRTIVGTIIKPSVGLTPEATAEQVKTLIEAGLDFIKDDELMGNPSHSPFKKRVDAVMAVINDYAQKTGKKPMYAFNLTGEVEEMKRRHDYLLSKGGNCVMVNLNWAGITGVMALSTHSQMPIHGHRNFWGALYRSDALGLSFPVFHKIYSMAGTDHIHTNGIRNKFCESDESVVRSIKCCLNPQGGGYPVTPVISSGQWADQAHDTYKAVGSADVMFLAGGGITAHPGGLAAGVKSIQVAWEGAVKGKTIEELAPQHPELQQAIEFYGKK